MKKIYLLAVMLLCSIVAFSQVKKVAILEIVDKEGKISYSQKLMLRSSLAKAVTNTAGYEAYDRTDMDAIMGEQDFQRTGMVSDDQIKRLGEMTGASYILVAEAVQADQTSLFVTAKILDVETARTEQTDYTTMSIGSKTILQGCEELAANLLRSKTVEVVAKPTHNVVSQKTPTPIDFGEPAMVRVGREYSYNDKYLTKREYENLLKNTCPEAYAQYKKGDKLIKAGWGLLIPGAIIMSVGFTTIDIAGYWPHEPYVWTITGIGAGCLVASAPLLSIGYIERNKRTLDIFNRKCAEPAITYNLTAGQNGLGLAINF